MNVYDCNICLLMLYLVHMLKALSFWIVVTPQSSGLSMLIKGLIKEYTNSETCTLGVLQHK